MLFTIYKNTRIDLTWDGTPPVWGGQAAVYRVTHPDKKYRAVKRELTPNSEWFDQEVKNLEDLHREHSDLEDCVIKLEAVGDLDGTRFMVFPWYEHTLESWIKDKGLSARLSILRELAKVVSRLHTTNGGLSRLNVVHRDIKPSNIFIDPEKKDGYRVILGDFGSSKQIYKEGETTYNTGCYTEGFAPVDQTLPYRIKNPHPSWDTYALAATVYTCLQGLPPQSILASYGSLTDKGLALKTQYKKYQEDVQSDKSPDPSVCVDIAKLRELDLKSLIKPTTPLPVDPDQKVLEDALRAMMETERRPYAAEWASWATRIICPELVKALNPNPQARIGSSQLIEGVLETVIRELESGQEWPPDIKRPLPRPWYYAFGAVGVAAAVVGLWPSSRDVALEVEGAPEWGELHIHIDGREITSDPGGNFPPVELVYGTHTLKLSARLPGSDRCESSTEEEITIPAGLSVFRLSIPAGELRCPSAEHSYTTASVQPGTFRAGSEREEIWRQPDEGSHTVTLSRGFEVGTTEISQALWREVMGSNPVETASVSFRGEPGPACSTYEGTISMSGDDLPVVCVTWCEAVDFANRLSEIEGLTPVYSGVGSCAEGGEVGWDQSADGWRLPTEAEWEYAARAGGAHTLYAGMETPQELLGDGEALRPTWAQLCKHANVADRSFQATIRQGLKSFPCDDGYAGLAPVESLIPNQWDLHHMTGNVWEWTWDRYEIWGDATSPSTDPVGPATGAQRVYRGGAFDDYQTLRLANRGAGIPTDRALIIGLRLARSRL